MTSNSLFRLVLAAVFAVALICMTAAAQSGRRLPKAAPTPEPSPPPVPAAKPIEKPKPALKLIVGAEQRGYLSGLPSYLIDSVVKACAERLDSAPSVEVTVSHRDVNRGEAIKTAKAEKEAYVVWLQLGTDSIGYDRQIDINDLYLQYVVFAPVTAKIAANGRTYPQGYGRGGVIVNPGRLPGSNMAYIEQALKQAARVAAERILDALKTDLPGERIPG